MASVLHYGSREGLKLDLPPGRLLAEFVAPSGAAVSDPAAAVAVALVNPIRFPPLARATVPGDRVAVVLDTGVPQQAALVAGVVQALLAGGIRAEDIAVVERMLDDGQPRLDPRLGLPKQLATRVRRVVHDPHDRRKLCYLAASAAGHAIYLNRTIYDADLVLPIGCIRPTRSLGLHGVHAGLFPTFSDYRTIERFRAAQNLEPASRRRRQKETDEVGWLLGISMAIRVVPAADDQVLRILAGDVRDVFEQGQRLCDAAWDFPVPQRASLVVASVGGDRSAQTWQNVGCALAASCRAVANDGAIVICTALRTVPGPALCQIGDLDDLQAACPRMRRDRSSHAWSAMQLIRAKLRGHVYLLSGLDDEVVEQTGMAPVASGDEINRLAQRHETCILLDHAQYAVPAVADEDESIDAA